MFSKFIRLFCGKARKIFVYENTKGNLGTSLRKYVTFTEKKNEYLVEFRVYGKEI